MKTLSIITINKNNSVGLQKTIRSVINQTFSDLEYIVIDGKSTDGSVAIIQEFADSINYWVSENDSGIYHAMNKALQLSSGTYCLFLNSGDYLYENSTLQTVFAKKQISDILYGNMLIDWNNGSLTVGRMPQRITLKHMIKDTLWHPVSFIKRNLFEKLGGYDESLSIAADYDFFLKAIFVEQASLAYLNQVISVFTVDGISSLPSNQMTLREERNKIQKRYFSASLIEKAKKDTFIDKLKMKFRFQ
jgi:glycosyltransferase involved in cell wall biosynthesis